jgi:hypothetical protein
VHTILDDRSRFLVMARAYRRERTIEATNNLWWALKKGRTPKAVYVDNGSCFISTGFREYCEARGIQVIYGRPYNPRAAASSSGSTGSGLKSSWGKSTSAPSATSVKSSSSGEVGTTTKGSTGGLVGRPPERRTTTAS